MIYRFRHGETPLEGYTIQRGVGRGGFGEVYYALSDGGREVALKVLLQNEEIELRGVRQCINLKNPNLVSIFDVRTGKDGTPFVVMEYVSGPSLRDLLRERRGGVGSQVAAFFVREIAKGLRYLHDRGIVHRDLKPENIFYEEGYVKIGDYGLSKLINTSQQSGQTISVGTVHYMAPEIGTGNYQRGIDIYALGVILFELLTGEVPFQGDSFGEILMKHVTAAPDLSRIAEPFRTAVEGALKKDPRERFGSADDLVRTILADPAIERSLGALDPETVCRSRSSIRLDARVATADGAAETLRLDSPAPVRAEPTPRPAARPEAAVPEDAAPRAAGAAEPVDDLTPPWLREAGEWARQAGSQAVRRLDDAVETLSSRLFRRRDDGEGAPPGSIARFFWVMTGCSLLAGALCCFLAPLAMEFRGDDVMAPVSGGLALTCYAGFALYRGLWARRRSFWRRTLRPFVLASISTAITISTAFTLFYLIAGNPFGYPQNEESGIAIVSVALSTAALAFLFTLDRAIERWKAQASKTEEGLSRHDRPPPVIVRAGDAILATIAIGTSIGCLWFALAEARGSQDVFVFLGSALAFAALAGFFLRQANRKRRGTLWLGTVRPFLAWTVWTTLSICALPFLIGVPLRGDERMVVLFAACCAVGLGAALAILRGPRRDEGKA